MALPWHGYWAVLPPGGGREAEPPGGHYLAEPSNEKTHPGGHCLAEVAVGCVRWNQ